jgi:carboxypeptidase Taq
MLKQILLIDQSNKLLTKAIDVAKSGRRLSKITQRKMSIGTESSASAYDLLRLKLEEIDCLESLSGLAGWDELTMMPKGTEAQRLRAKASSALAGVIHEKRTAKELGELIDLSAQIVTGNDSKKDFANVKRAKEDYVRATKIPSRMAKRQATLASEGYQVWAKAREENDFRSFAPVLKDWVELVKERCELIRPGEDAFNTSLDEYERGMTKERLDEIFPVVKTCVVDLIKKVYEKEKPVALEIGENVLGGKFSTDTQAKLSQEIALKLGFDLDCGRLDVSVHPFTGGCGPGDVRMTTRYKENDLSEGLTGTIHETGHALYEQGRNVKEYANQPVSRAHSMGVHESQSLLWERMVALSPSFATFLLPELKREFPKEFEGVTEAQLHASFNIVKNPSVIRVEADELTYPLHILLRTELEIGLMRGSIDVDDLPKLWNEKMKSYLNVDVEDDTRGVLQDVHWSSGAFGYFPTYLLGAMYACQIYETAKKALPTLEHDIAIGKFAPLREWLRVEVHDRGSEFDSADELLMKVTGKPLDADAFTSYLTTKYTKLYGL